jgi:hypothetical protein
MQMCKGSENKRSIWSRTLAFFHLLLLRVFFLVVLMIFEQQNI